MTMTRRKWMRHTAGGLLLAGLPGCTDWSRRLGSVERRLLLQDPLEIVKWRIESPDYASVLRRRAVSARHLAPSFLARLDARMRATLTRSGGVGLAAPQVGLCRRVILVQLQRPGKPLLTLVDPTIHQTRGPLVQGYEACLSVDGMGGKVGRVQAVEVFYFDVHGRPHHLASSGWEARIVQHEVDHLEGVLYLDRLTGPLLPLEEMRRRRRRERARARAERFDGEAGGWLAEARALRQEPEGSCLL